MNEKTALYRLFNADDRLLYVGISNDPKVRWKQHLGDKSWAPDVVMRVIEWYESRSAALLAEIKAIKNERPEHNVVHRHPQPAPAEPREPSDLPTNGRNRSLAKHAYCTATAILRADVLRAIGEGIPETEIARRAGIDRMTVRAWAGK